MFEDGRSFSFGIATHRFLLLRQGTLALDNSNCYVLGVFGGIMRDLIRRCAFSQCVFLADLFEQLRAEKSQTKTKYKNIQEY